MKKFFAALLASLCLVLASCIPAHADVKSEAKASISVQTEVYKAAPAIHVTPLKSRGIGGGVIKPLYTWLPPQYCFWQTGITSYAYYCYRYGCTYFEKVAWGCYEGYIRINTVYRV